MSGVPLLASVEDHRPNGRPLVVVDVDEVVLGFVGPLSAFLERRGFRLHPRSYALTGNVTRADGVEAVPGDLVKTLIADFFAAEVDAQPAVEGAVTALDRLGAASDLVLLTNVPAAQAARRAVRLASLGFAAPMVANDGGKGPAVARLASMARARGGTDLPVVFVDDGPAQLVSVRGALADARLVQFVADPVWFAMAPEVPGVWLKTREWREVVDAVETLPFGPARRCGTTPLASSPD